LQDDGSAAPEIIDLSMFDLDQLLNQLLTDADARTEMYGAQEERRIAKDSGGRTAEQDV
jgi:hypothetical protein